VNLSIDQPLRETIEHGGPYKMRTIAELSGFSPAVLRAWERRHKLLHPRRGSGGQRVYTDDDLQVLLRVRDLMARGRSIGEIARVGRKALLEQQQGASRQPKRFEPFRVSRPEEPERIELEKLRVRIVNAALNVDPGSLSKALNDAFACVAAETVVFEVIKPSAVEIGKLWAAGQCSIASEHLASGIFVHRLLNLVETSSPLRSQWRPFVVACFPDEYHQLAALMIAYLLVRNGARVSFLGPALPLEDLETTAELIQPAAVLLSVTRTAVFQVNRSRFLQTLKGHGGRTPFFLGGQGVPLADKDVERFGARIISPDRDTQDVIAGILTSMSPRPQ